MRIVHFSGLLLALVLGCSDADVDQSVSIEIPAAVASIPSGTLHVVLYRYDPMLMDALATEADRVAVPFTHVTGQRTVRRARVRGRGVGGERFYLSVDGCDSSAEGARSVLWDGLMVELPSRVVMQPRSAPLPPCSNNGGSPVQLP